MRIYVVHNYDDAVADRYFTNRKAAVAEVLAELNAGDIDVWEAGGSEVWSYDLIELLEDQQAAMMASDRVLNYFRHQIREIFYGAQDDLGLAMLELIRDQDERVARELERIRGSNYGRAAAAGLLEFR